MPEAGTRAARLTRDRLRLAIREAVGRHVDLDRYELFIFGSEASGTGTVRSDIDVGIRGPQPLSNVVMQRIRADLERLPTLRMFDVVDFSAADPAFTSQALDTIEKL